MANEIAKLTADLNIIAKLDDEPNDVGGLSAAELKAEFDKAGLTIQKYINETLLPNVDEISDSFMLVRVTGEAPDLVADKTAKEINDFARAGGLPVMVTGGTASALYYNPAKSPITAPFVAIMGQTAPGEREGTMQTIVLTVNMDKTVIAKSYDHNTSAKAHMDIRALITRNQQSLKLLKDAVDRHIADMDNPHGVTYDQVGADPAGAADAAQAAAISAAKGNVTVADCFDVAESPTSAPNTWYVPKTSPRPSGEAGMTIDVRWKNGRVDGLGYDVSLIWGAPDGSDNETVVSAASVSTGLSGTYSIPTEGTVRYQLIEQSGRLRWHYVSGKLLPRQFSSATAAATADKSVPGMEVEYLPGMEIYVQMDNGNTADVMRLVPGSGPTLPVYGNGAGAKTGEIPAGYILHLASAGDHWQIINGGSGGGVTPDQLNEPRHTTLVVHAFTHGIGYKADVKASLIKRHYDGGGIVLLNFDAPDGTGEQSYRYETYKDYRDGRGAVAVFRRPVVDVAGKVVKRIVIKIDEKENVYQEEESLDVPQIDDKAPGADTTYSGEKVDQLLTSKADRDYVTPQMFGAAGDGVTDDTDAFNACQTMAKGKVIVPPGKYFLNNFTFNRQCIWEFQHDTKEQQWFSGDSYIATSTGITITGGANIKNIRVEYSGAETIENRPSGIKVGSYVTITGLFVRGFYVGIELGDGAGIGAWYSRISNFYSWYNYFSGVRVDASDHNQVNFISLLDGNVGSNGVSPSDGSVEPDVDRGYGYYFRTCSGVYINNTDVSSNETAGICIDNRATDKQTRALYVGIVYGERNKYCTVYYRNGIDNTVTKTREVNISTIFSIHDEKELYYAGDFYSDTNYIPPSVNFFGISGNAITGRSCVLDNILTGRFPKKSLKDFSMYALAGHFYRVRLTVKSKASGSIIFQNYVCYSNYASTGNLSQETVGYLPTFGVPIGEPGEIKDIYIYLTFPEVSEPHDYLYYESLTYGEGEADIIGGEIEDITPISDAYFSYGKVPNGATRITQSGNYQIYLGGAWKDISIAT